MAALLAAWNYTTRRAGIGRPPETSVPHAFITRQHYCPMARSSLQVVRVIPAAFSRARNYTIRQPELGLLRAASTLGAIIPRRRCCPMARCWWQGELIAAALFPARNCTNPTRFCPFIKFRPRHRRVESSRAAWTTPTSTQPSGSNQTKRCCTISRLSRAQMVDLWPMA